ncbi:MAG: BMP family ABC transporter substrate-binding protein [Actinomycetota bacterium]|jgi:basic membrane protein A
MKGITRLSTGLATASLLLGSLTIGLSATAASAATTFKACVVVDTGGINDHSFNQSAYEGMKAAQMAAGGSSKMKTSYLTSQSSADYTSNINTFISQKCGIIVTVGFNMGTATATAAIANPKQKFAIVDDILTDKNYAPLNLKNVIQLTYNTNEDAFLGGYYAAATSKTGVIATYGGMQFSTVSIYMDGFVAGARAYNKASGKHVKVLGWKPSADTKGMSSTADRVAAGFPGTGSFVGNFTDQNAGQTLTNTFFSQGADVVFPVAGGVGIGSLTAAAKATGKMIMWVDVNGCAVEAKFCKYIDASVTKGLKVSVKGAILSAFHKTFNATKPYVGTLKNKGAEFILNKKVSASLKAALNKAAAGIKAGTVSVNPMDYPASTN